MDGDIAHVAVEGARAVAHRADLVGIAWLGPDLDVVANMSTDFFDAVHYDVWAQTYASKPFDATAQRRSARSGACAKPNRC
jgi:hypothetical protein